MQTRLDLPDAAVGKRGPSRGLGRTYRDTRNRPVHRWYGYVEGFSSTYLSATFDELGTNASAIYDPFGGAGTSLLEASRRGARSYFAEANPFMAFVSETKVNAGLWAAREPDRARHVLQRFRDTILSTSFRRDAHSVDLTEVHRAFASRTFFDDADLRQLVHALRLTAELVDSAPEAVAMARLACAANVVDSSHMTRRADLRRRKPDEYRTRVVEVPTAIASTLTDMLVDLDHLNPQSAATVQVATDCRRLPDRYHQAFDFAITSPPYLNGTNYVRNTKLELTLLGFVDSEDQLGSLRKLGICAGITQATASRLVRPVDEAERVASELDECAADRRIPQLIRAYFSDMEEVLRSVYASLKAGALFVLDIGDSKFYGVHVPTDRILVAIARRVGFLVEQDVIIAQRHSRDKSPLVQVDLRLRKP